MSDLLAAQVGVLEEGTGVVAEHLSAGGTVSRGATPDLRLAGAAKLHPHLRIATLAIRTGALPLAVQQTKGDEPVIEFLVRGAKNLRPQPAVIEAFQLIHASYAEEYWIGHLKRWSGSWTPSVCQTKSATRPIHDVHLAHCHAPRSPQSLVF